jgi:hypothetical protein
MPLDHKSLQTVIAGLAGVVAAETRHSNLNKATMSCGISDNFKKGKVQ